MSRRKPRSSRSNHERWLVSYADFITLLFAFFVVLYASSQVDKRKVGKLALAIQVAFQEMGVFQASTTEVPIDLASPMPFSTAQAIENSERTGSLGQTASHPQGAPGTSVENGDLAQLQKELESALTIEIGRQEIAMRREPDGLISARMKPTSQGTFDRIADILRQRDYRLRIEGHTDNAPIHTSQFPSNWELSSSRATEMVRLLIVRDGFSPGRLSAGGFAEYHPVATNRTAEGRAINRRVDIVILGHGPTEASIAQSGLEVSKPVSAVPADPPAGMGTAGQASPGVVVKPTAARDTSGHLQQ